MIPLIVILSTVAMLSDPFSAGETGPAMLIIHEPDEPIVQQEGGFSQSLQLHPGWNLVSWHIEPLEPDIYMWQILPLENAPPPYVYADWFFENGGELYKWDDADNYYPLTYQELVWDLNYAYYMWLDESHNWNEFQNRPRFDLEPVTNIIPNNAWAHDDNVGYPNISYWFFMGYAAPGYCKLASIVNSQYLPQPPSGDPQYFDFEGPFHRLIWDENNNWQLYDLKIVKDDEGRLYIPRPGQGRPPYDNLGVLEPGRGYFLGFSDDGPYDFEGWGSWPQWQNEIFAGSDPKSSQQQTASANHFLYNKYTHWSYPIYIDTVDQAQCPMASGDEIGAFDGDRCVGAAVYSGEFPLVVVAWEDDKATPMEVDGYIYGNNMTFIWYDASENAEVEFELPPMTQAMQDDPVAPQYAGFGCGLYGRRSFMEGISKVNQLPQAYHLGQNYPNPFNSTTILPLELPQRSKIKLEIFNVKGQRLGLPYERVYNPGWPKIRWSASKLPSGVYFYRITAEGLERGGKFQDSGKMLLLK